MNTDFHRRLRWFKRRWLLTLVPRLEAQFQQERRHTYVPSILVAAVTAFSLLTLYLGVDFFSAARFFRWQFLLPILLLAALPALMMVLAIITRKTRALPLWWIAVPAFSNGLCWAVLPSVGDRLGLPWPYEVILFNFLYVYFFSALPSRLSALIGILIGTIFMLLKWLSAAHNWQLFTQAFVLFGFLAHVVVAATMLERNERHAWLTRRRLADLARRDGLTGLFNRRSFFEQAAIALKQARRSKAALALLLIDADHFKRFNDTYGHGAGDACLQRLAGTFAQAAQRPLDCAARIGGEEFVLLFFDAPDLWAMTRAEDLCAAVRRLNHEDNPCTSVSVGLAIGDGHSNIATLLQRADATLYRAKSAGRDRIAT